jgi:hypothetical protein
METNISTTREAWGVEASGNEGWGYTTKCSQQSTKATSTMRAVMTPTTRAIERARAKRIEQQGPWRNLPRGRREMMVLLWRWGYTTINSKGNSNGEDSGGINSEGGNKGGKDYGVRGYNGDGGNCNDGGDCDDGGDGDKGGEDDSKRRQRQQERQQQKQQQRDNDGDATTTIEGFEQRQLWWGTLLSPKREALLLIRAAAAITIGRWVAGRLARQYFWVALSRAQNELNFLAAGLT